MILIALLAAATTLSACSQRRLPDNYQLAVPTAFPPSAAAEIPLGIGDVVEVSYFKSYEVAGPYRLGTGDVLDVVVRPGDPNQPYTLATGDQIDVVVKGTTDRGTYRLQVGDEVSVVVPTRPDLSHSVAVLRDGSVVLPVIGPTVIRGMTIREAVAALTRRYRNYLDAPQIDLLVTKSAMPELRENVTVLPDGSGTVPLLGRVALRGKSADEIVRELSVRYAAHFDTPTVDVLVTRSSPTVTYRVSLLPDGRVTLPQLGPVSLRGMSVEQASAVLTERYTTLLGRVVVDVLVAEPGGRVDDFFGVLVQSPQGAVRDGTVTDDGLLRLPLISPISAVDRLFADVSAEIERAYGEVMPELDVNTTFALRRSQRKITVVGEVFRGGVFDEVQPISVLQALALAGGVTDRAWRAQVLLLHPDYRERTLTVRVIDMTKGLNMTDASLLATTVRPQDIVYVPRSRIGDVNVFVQQYLTGLIPFNLRVNVFAGGRQLD